MKLTKNKILKNIITVGLYFIPLSLVFFYFINFKDINKFFITEILLCNIPLLIFSFNFLVEKIDTQEKKFVYFNAGFFVYTLCSTLLFSVGNIKSEIIRFIWEFNVYLYLTYQILIFVEWYKNFRKKPINIKHV